MSQPLTQPLRDAPHRGGNEQQDKQMADERRHRNRRDRAYDARDDEPQGR